MQCNKSAILYVLYTAVEIFKCIYIYNDDF